MTATFDPATADLAELRADLKRIREEKGRGSGYSLDAFNRLNVASHAQGRPLNALRRHSLVESERFFALAIPGPDGHVYWDGLKAFRRNDGKHRWPARWWWEHRHGSIGSPTLRLYPTCGDGHCINPDHKELRHFVEARYSEAQMLGALQVMALRLGHAPSTVEWTQDGGKPTPMIFVNRFGSWRDAVKAAGLEYRDRRVGPQDCIKALRCMRQLLGRWPTSKATDFRACREVLLERKLPASETTIRRHLGDWPTALRRAGKR